jgi:hypothetical protein
VLAHIGGAPVEESLVYLTPVVLVVGWIYLQRWRERRNPELAERRNREEQEQLRRLDDDLW